MLNKSFSPAGAVRRARAVPSTAPVPSPALPARALAKKMYGEVSARTDHKLFRASDYLPTGGVDIRDSEYRQRISRRTWGSEKALGVDPTHAQGQPESSSALAAASRVVGLRTSRSMEQLMTKLHTDEILLRITMLI